MRILSIPTEAPWPAHSGGRVDVWRRLSQLQHAGAQVSLLSWHDPARDQVDALARDQALRSVVNDHRLLPILRGAGPLAQRMTWLGRLPSHAASRWLAAQAQRQAVLAWARQQAPEVILLDGLYGGAVAQWLATTLSVPLVYRSHNIEHAYMREQMRLSRSLLGTLGLAANRVGLRSFEEGVIREARLTLDISLDDMHWWQASGMPRMHWLPTSVDPDFARRLAEPSVQDIDLLYFGNLNTPNNIDAVRWLVSEVLPALPNSPGVTLTVAGSRPDEALRHWLSRFERVRLIDSPPDMAAVIRRAKVLVNPLRAGSGVNLKSVEMLFSKAALVATPLAVRGLPPAAQACFELAEDTQAMARLLGQALVCPAPDVETRRQVRASFTGEQALRLLESASMHATPTPAG